MFDENLRVYGVRKVWWRLGRKASTLPADLPVPVDVRAKLKDDELTALEDQRTPGIEGVARPVVHFGSGMRPDA